MKRLLFLTVLSALLLPLTGFEARAETRVFIKEHTYQASDIDSKVSSRAIALQQVKRALLEELGTYLLSRTEARNYLLSLDVITTLSAGIVRAEVLKEAWDGRTYYLQARLTVDPDAVARHLADLAKDRETARSLEESWQRTDDALRETSRLRSELQSGRTDSPERFEQQTEYSRAIQDLGHDDWFSGYRFTLRDGSSFEWDQYQVKGESYCTRRMDGTVCIPVRDVVSITIGARPAGVEVLTGKQLDGRERRKAEQDWQATQKANEKELQAAECSRLADELEQLRNTDRYQDAKERYRSACGRMQQGSTAGTQKTGSTRSKSSSSKSKRSGDMDRIMQDARDGSVF